MNYRQSTYPFPISKMFIFRIVKLLISLLVADGKGSSVLNKKRFVDEFQSIQELPGSHLPEDYIQTFAGNVDDAFKLGIGITKNCLKVSCPFSVSLRISSFLCQWKNL